MSLFLFFSYYFLFFLLTITTSIESNTQDSSSSSFPSELSVYRAHDLKRKSTTDGLNNWVGSRMHDGAPFLFTSRLIKNGTSQPYTKSAIFCLYPKAGSTNLKFLLR